MSKTTAAYLWVTVAISQLVQVEQRLVDVLLQSQRCLHRIQQAAPLLTLGFLSKTSLQVSSDAIIKIALTMR